MLYLEVVVQGRRSFLSGHLLAATLEVLSSWISFMILWCTWHIALLTYFFPPECLMHFTLWSWILIDWYPVIISHGSFFISRSGMNFFFSPSHSYSLQFIYCVLQCHSTRIFHCILHFLMSPTICKCPKLEAAAGKLYCPHFSAASGWIFYQLICWCLQLMAAVLWHCWLHATSMTCHCHMFCVTPCCGLGSWQCL